ncbi:HAMP domain-containing sensor histidine kinase [Tunturiibacter empetritectus]|uniref:histidine kinase dimerization/phospho-acceptor domain-containing protein n=1 Tax=Tunturiibacter empetritectus TaxID=3069691 RepID=UPI003D9B8EA5
MRELEPLVSAIESALLRLEQSFAQQKQFVSDAAHELKTSVAVVKSSLQLLTMRTRSAKEYEEGLERVTIDSERMEELVAKMLTLARLEDGAEQPESYRTVELGDVLRDVAEHFRTLASLPPDQPGDQRGESGLRLLRSRPASPALLEPDSQCDST